MLKIGDGLVRTATEMDVLSENDGGNFFRSWEKEFEAVSVKGIVEIDSGHFKF